MREHDVTALTLGELERARRELAAGSGVLDEEALSAKSKLSQDIEQGRVVPPGITGTDTQPGGQ